MASMLELVDKMRAGFSRRWWKVLMVTAIVTLVLLNPNGSLAAGEGAQCHRSDSSTPPLLARASISGYVWYDDDGDGVWDEIEGGIGGVTIDLYRDNDGDGVVDPNEKVLETQITTADGAYHFTDLTPGNYIVDVTDSRGVLTEYALTTANDPQPISLREGEHYDGANFGYEAVARPTAIALSAFAARSGPDAATAWRWEGLVGLIGLGVGGMIWRRRQRP